MPRKIPDLDLDFQIYVDPSCLSEPMNDETAISQVSPAPQEAHEKPIMALEETVEVQAVGETKDVEQPAEESNSDPGEESQEPPESGTETATTADDTNGQPEPETQEQPLNPTTKSEPAPEMPEDSPCADVPTEEQPAPEIEDAAPPAAEEESAPAPEEALAEDTASSPEVVVEPESAPEAEVQSAPEPEQAEQSIATEPTPDSEEQSGDVTEEPTAETQESSHVAAEEQDPLLEPQPEEAQVQDTTAAEDANIAAVSEVDADQESAPQSHPITDRKTSLRTEALIQAAARAVVAKIEKRKSQEAAPAQDEDDFDNSLLSTDSQDTYTAEDADVRSTYSGHHSPARRESSGSQVVSHIPSRSTSSDDAGDSSSHHEPDDDMFSDRSARSSLYSLDDPPRPHDEEDNPDAVKTPQAKEHLSRRESFASSSSTTRHTQSPRAVSGLSMISGLSQYEDKQFVPTSRDHRMPFRTPSEIRAMQMASPTPSVFNGSSPRSSKRQSLGGGGGLSPSFSRVGSPTVSAQYSPKGRSTPPRFKSPRKEAPLVLLHVTLLPLRWVWGDIVNGVDAVVASNSGKDFNESATFNPSEQLKTLRDAWRELQDRVGDTVLERGILLPHPQNDYEVLEERLLEALELPLRRRARILECGHYLGPANEMMGDGCGFGDEEGIEDEEDKGEDGGKQRHWCNTCRDEIRYEQLGPGKVFRVKVYASNGLMKAGAWEACWKEMERVDVELEPIVDLALQNELERLGAVQLEMEEQRQREQQQQQEAELERAVQAVAEVEMNRTSTPLPAQLRTETPSRQQSEADLAHQRAMMSSPLPSAMQLARVAGGSSRPVSRQTEPIDTSEERRRRDEERMREIYGEVPAAAAPAPVPAPAQLPVPAPVDPYQQQLQPHPQQSQALTLTHQPAIHHQPHQHPGYPPHNEQQDPYHHQRPQSPHETPKRRGGIVLDENSGFVELLMEAFKVLLRDPKNVAIIVLCVFLVVMMKRPGQQANTGLEVANPVRYQSVNQGQMQVEEVPVMQVQSVEGARKEVEVEMGVVRVPQVEAPVVEAPEAKEVPEVVAAEVEVVQDAPGPEPEAEVLEQVQEAEVEPEVAPEVVEQEVLADHLVQETETAVEPEAMLDVCSIADLLAIWALQYPMSGLEDYLYVAEVETETPELTVGKDEDLAVSEDETPETTEKCAAPAEAVENDDTTELEQPACDNSTESDDESDDYSIAIPTQASTSSLFIPGPYVTERKTVRVFETVTETVRVSVVTQTETVSTVVTAVPQTVEETVYETETVRITVSVPVEEREKEKDAKKAGKGAKKEGKKGRGMCAGWL